MTVKLAPDLGGDLVASLCQAGSSTMSSQIAIRREEEGRGPVTFRLLGAVQMTAGGQPLGTGPEQQQRLLVKLLAARGMPVAIGELKEAIWDDVLGPGATHEALYHRVVTLRRQLAEAGLGAVLTNANGTYCLAIPPEQVDVHVFRTLTARARELDRAGDRQAVVLLEQALGLRYGEPLAGLGGRWIDGYRHTLAGEVQAAELSLYQTAIRHGEAPERLPGLATLLRERPDDEFVAWLYMHALYRSGQQTQALAVKRQFSAYLLETNGVTNGQPLDDLYQRILAGDEELLGPEAVSFPADKPGARVRPLSNPDPRASQDRAGEEPGPAPEDPGSSPGDPADAGRREPAAAGSSFAFHGPVHAPDAVFGNQVNHNYGGPR
jgi:DNA-binding SARP family transcriptional activator